VKERRREIDREREREREREKENRKTAPPRELGIARARR